MFSSDDVGFSPGVTKKTFTPGMVAWIKVLSADLCPGSGSCDRIDETGSAFSVADNYSPFEINY
jgi:hypothetical protein